MKGQFRRWSHLCDMQQERYKFLLEDYGQEQLALKVSKQARVSLEILHKDLESDPKLRNRLREIFYTDKSSYLMVLAYRFYLDEVKLLPALVDPQGYVRLGRMTLWSQSFTKDLLAEILH